MNEPPPVLHNGTMYSWPTGGSPGLLIVQLVSPVPTLPGLLQSTMLIGKMSGMNPPLMRAPATAVASADAANWLNPITRPNVVPNDWVPPTWTPCAPGGMVPTTPTWAAAAWFGA